MVECEKIIQSNEQEGFLVEGILIVHLRTILTNREQKKLFNRLWETTSGL